MCSRLRDFSPFFVLCCFKGQKKRKKNHSRLLPFPVDVNVMLKLTFVCDVYSNQLNLYLLVRLTLYNVFFSSFSKKSLVIMSF